MRERKDRAAWTEGISGVSQFTEDMEYLYIFLAATSVMIQGLKKWHEATAAILKKAGTLVSVFSEQRKIAAERKHPQNR